MNKSEEELTNSIISNHSIEIPDIYLEEFINSITENRIKNLYLKFKLYESKGYITHDKYLQSMKEIFDQPIKTQINKIFEDIYYNQPIDIDINIESYINEIYELYFLRFREIKCIIKNNKTVFFLTDLMPVNFINTYNVICSLIIFFKSCFDNKIKLLFYLTDIDEDGFLNENEIKNMIATCNFLFCEEGNIINTSSSILSQSLMNLKVNNIFKEIIYDPGNLYIYLEEEKYINFEILFKSIKLVKDYKYKIIPCYINLKHCLSNVKKEKIIKIKDKYKYDFINISSSLFLNKSIGNHQSLKYNKNLSISYLGGIIKPKKIIKNYDDNKSVELPNINKHFFNKRNSIVKKTKKSIKNALYKNIINENTSNNFNNSTVSRTIDLNTKDNKNKFVFEKSKSFKELLKESTIIEMENQKNKNNKTFNNAYYNSDNREIKYIFEANFEKIRNIEVKPGVIKFINNKNEYNSSNSSKAQSSHNVIPNLKLKKEKSDIKKKISEKIVNFNFNNKEKDIQNSSYEEKSSDSQKKKIIKTASILKNENYKNEFKNIDNIVTQDNITKNINIENINHLINFYRNPHSRLSSLKKKINNLNNINLANLQKSIFNIIYNDGKRYKTLDEVFHEIKVQQNKFNNDSYIGYCASLINSLKSIKDEQKDIKKILGNSDKKDLSLAFHKNFLNKLSKRKKQIIWRSQSIN